MGCAFARERVSICELNHNPDRYLAHEVIVHAQLLSNGVDLVNLVDNHCPDATEAARFTTDPAKRAKLAKLEAALQAPSPGTAGKVIVGDFIGTFSTISRLARTVGALKIEAVENLDVGHEPP